MEVHRKRLAKFHDAIFHSDLRTVTRLLAKGVNVNATYRGETAFTLATACIVVDQRHGYEDPERQRSRELIAEAIFNDLDIDPKARSKNKRTALHAAASMGREDWVAKLIGLGAKVSKKDVAGDTPVILATYDNKISCLRRMIETGCVDVHQPNEKGYTLLHLACQRFSPEAVGVLLKHGCDIQALGPLGENALMVALDAWERLALETKLLPKWLEVTELLIQAGCDVNGRDGFGRTLIDRLIDTKNVYGTCLLLERGCDTSLSNSLGFTPVQSAIRQGSYEIAKLLLHYNSKWEKRSDSLPTISERYGTHSSYLPSATVVSALQSFKCVKTFESINVSESLVYGLIASSHSSLHFFYLKGEIDSIETSTMTPLSETNQARLSDTKRNIQDYITDILKGPFSLQHISRLKIRDILGCTGILGKIEQLPIPFSLKRFVNLGVALDKCRLDKTVQLHAAVTDDNLEKMRVSLQEGADARVFLKGVCALQLALQRASDEIVTELFNHLCFTQSDFPTTSGFHKEKLCNTNALSSDLQTLSHCRGKPCGTELLLFSESEDTALHLVAKAGRSRHVGSAVRLSPEQLSTRNAKGRTSLGEAAAMGLPSHNLTAEAIIIHGAIEISSVGATSSAVEDLTLADMGVTLIHLACAAGALPLVDCLLRNGCFTVNCVDSFGYTPLDLAESQGKHYRLLGKSTSGLNIGDLVLFILKTENETGQFRQVMRLLLDFGDKFANR